MAPLSEVFVLARPNMSVFGRELQSGVIIASRRAGKDMGTELERSAKDAGKKAGGSLAGSMKSMLIGGAIFGGAGLFGKFFEEAEEAVKVGRITDNTLRSMGATAWVSSQQIGALATSISNKVGVDDEAIQSGENLLLTFGNIRNEVGRGNDIFNQATQLVVDMTAAMNNGEVSQEGMKQSAVKLGKALNDPIAGLSALTKYGVSFTAQQKEQIKALVASGDTLSAQKIILKELSREFGGTAEAAATPFAKLRVQLDNLAETVGLALMPTLEQFTSLFGGSLMPIIGDVASKVGSILVPVLRTTFGAVKQVLDVFSSLPGPVQTGLLAFLAWRTMGGPVNDMFSKITENVRGARGELGQIANSGEVSKFAAGIQLLQDKVPIIGAVAGGFREAKGDLTGFAATAKGVGGAAFGGLKSAASGLTATLGGPWGVALAGGITLLSAFSVMSQRAEARHKELADAGKEVAKAIRDENGAINDNVRIKAAQQLEDAHLLEKADQFGISTKSMTNAILGQGNALKGITAQLERYAEAHTHMESGEGGATEVMDKEGSAAIQLRDDLNELVNGKHSQAAADKRVTEASGENKVATEAQTDAVKKQRQAVDDLLTALQKYWGELAAHQDTAEAWEASWDKLTESVKANGTTLDITTEAGRNNRDAIEELITTDQRMMQQDIDSQVPMDQVIQKHNDRISAIITESDKLGIDTKKTQDLVAAYDTVPPSVKTTLTQLGYDPIRQQLITLSAIQQLLAKGEEINEQNINARVRHNLGITSFGTTDFAGGRAEGGRISGPGTGTSDTAGLFALSDNEFVQRAAATQYYGVPFMEALNNMAIPREMIPGFRAGGLVGNWPVDFSKTMVPTREQMEQAWWAKHVPAVGTGGNVQRWAPLVMSALGLLGQSSSLLPNVLRRMNQESGGNPNAINLWDSNARKGTPSIGLMQVIQPTFDRWAAQFKPRGIYDPMANIFAGLNYAIHRYPSLQYAMDKPGGYRLGGLVKKYDMGGVWKNGTVGVNTSGSDEYVVNPNRTPIGGKHYHLHMNVSNTPVDLMTQFVRAELLEPM